MWEKIKKIIDSVGGRFVIVEDGKPRYVVTEFEEFERLVSNREAIRAENFAAVQSQKEDRLPAGRQENPFAFGVETATLRSDLAGASSPKPERGQGVRGKTVDLIADEEEAAAIKLDELPL